MSNNTTEHSFGSGPGAVCMVVLVNSWQRFWIFFKLDLPIPVSYDPHSRIRFPSAMHIM